MVWAMHAIPKSKVTIQPSCKAISCCHQVQVPGVIPEVAPFITRKIVEFLHIKKSVQVQIWLVLVGRQETYLGIETRASMRKVESWLEIREKTAGNTL